MRTDPDFCGTTCNACTPWCGCLHSQDDSSLLYLGKFVSNILVQEDRNIVGSEQSKGLNVWLWLDLKAVLDGAKSNEYAWELLGNRRLSQGVNLGWQMQ